MIVYEMFLQKFNSYHCTDEQYEQYKVIHEYVTELKQNGWVTFERSNTTDIVGTHEQLISFKKFLQSEYHLPISNRMVDEFEHKQSS